MRCHKSYFFPLPCSGLGPFKMSGKCASEGKQEVSVGTGPSELGLGGGTVLDHLPKTSQMPQPQMFKFPKTKIIKMQHLNLFIDLFERHREKQTDKWRKLLSADLFPKAHTSRDKATMKPGARNLTQVSHNGWQDSMTWDTVHCLLRSASAGS